MDRIVFLAPSKYRHLGYTDIMQYSPDDFPRLHASIDGKPSEVFDPTLHYVSASLICDNPNEFARAFAALSERYGAPLVKPAKLRAKRRLQYLRRIAQCLVELRLQPAGFPLVVLTSMIDGSLLDPTETLTNLRFDPTYRAYHRVIGISDTHVTFDLISKHLQVSIGQFAGILHWLRIAIAIDRYFTEKRGEPAIWMLHADRLPSDVEGDRMMILGRFLDEKLDGRVWVTYTLPNPGTADLEVDLLTDIFVSIFYEILAPEGSKDPNLLALMSKFLGSFPQASRRLPLKVK